MVETVKKPSSNRSAKERRNTLFRVLDGFLSLAHKKIQNGGNSDRLKQSWAKLAGPNTTKQRSTASICTSTGDLNASEA